MQRSFGLLLCLLAACDNSGSFDGVPKNPPPPGPSFTAADIGTRCIYQGDGINPTNSCPSGLDCLIFTRDGLYTSGLGLSAWEDQFTLYNPDGTDEGYCTLVGRTTDRAPLQCPLGTELKVFWPDASQEGGITACLRTCTNAASCGRPNYTCDVRFLDVLNGRGEPIPLCVRGCGLDVPDCVRSGVIVANNQGDLLPVLAAQDLAGASMCVDDGSCSFVGQRGVAAPGEPCTTTVDCREGAVCMQGPVLSVVVDRAPALDPEGPGFCAKPCDARPEVQNACGEVGFVCQDVGNLNLGFDPPIVADLQTGELGLAGGLCFHQCQLGVNASCSAIAATECGSLHAQAVGAAWNGISMCLPPSIRQ